MYLEVIRLACYDTIGVTSPMHHGKRGADDRGDEGMLTGATRALLWRLKAGGALAEGLRFQAKVFIGASIGKQGDQPQT